MSGLTADLGPDDCSRPGWHDGRHDTAVARLLGLASGAVTIRSPPGPADLGAAHRGNTLQGSRITPLKFADYPAKRSANKGVRVAVSEPAGAADPTFGMVALRSPSDRRGRATTEDVTIVESYEDAVRLAGTECPVPGPAWVYHWSRRRCGVHVPPRHTR